VNSSQETDTLVAVEGEGFRDAEIEGSSGTSASPTTGAGSGSGTTTGAGSRPAAGELEIPADTTVFVDGDAATITLTDLDQSLTVGQYIEVTLSFENAGDVTLQVTPANPDEAEERGEAFDFHQEEHSAEEGTEDTARERESRRQESGGQ
jgi:hypothetical protein